MSPSNSSPVVEERHSSDMHRGIVLVDGDVTIDWHIASQRNPDQAALWHREDERVPVIARPGGAALLGELIQGVAKKINENQVESAAWEVVYRPVLNDGGERFPRLYNAWHQYETLDSEGWRISQFLGSEPAANPQTPPPLLSDEIKPALIILDDKGHEFRKDPGWWRQYTSSSPEGTWFMIRTGRPLRKEGVWSELSAAHCSQLIAVMTADDIRQSEVFVSRQLSWERTAQDLYWEVLKNAALSQFVGCAFIVVCFTASAVVILEKIVGTSDGESEDQSSATRCWLVYDPTSLEEEEWLEQENGRVHGFTYCVMAAIARALFQRSSGRPDPATLANLIKSGLEASRSLYQRGFEMREDGGIAFPTARIVNQVISEPTQTWGVVQVPPRKLEEGQEPGKGWTILEEQARQNYNGLEELAKRIVKEGIDQLGKEIPVYKVGKLVVADRREIEGYRSIQRLLKEYAAQQFEGGARPLSIGVFGPPGSGKSFGIKQLAKSAFRGVDFQPLTFNLSQLTDPVDLRGAFHQIRDSSLHGKLPLVFWDEFDSIFNRQPLGWLRYFLAPMQDGLFHEGQITHPIGRSIFVFAGGTKPTMREFQDAYAKDKDEQAQRRKAPDFISRLRGYLNILGINPSPSPDADPLYIIRRAIVLNAQLNEHAPQSIIKLNNGRREFDIDEGVLRALLKIVEYRHGARSMEATISMSLLSGRNRFERSSLPPEAQLDLHVDATQFNKLLQGEAE